VGRLWHAALATLFSPGSELGPASPPPPPAPGFRLWRDTAPFRIPTKMETVRAAPPPWRERAEAPLLLGRLPSFWRLAPAAHSPARALTHPLIQTPTRPPGEQLRAAFAQQQRADERLGAHLHAAGAAGGG
jgi:hypothetical protein